MAEGRDTGPLDGAAVEPTAPEPEPLPPIARYRGPVYSPEELRELGRDVASAVGLSPRTMLAAIYAEGPHQFAERWGLETGRAQAVIEQGILHGWDTPVYMGGGVTNTPRAELQGIIDQVRAGRTPHDFSYGPGQQVYVYAPGSLADYTVHDMMRIRAELFDLPYALRLMAEKLLHYSRLSGGDIVQTLCRYNFPAGNGECAKIVTDDGSVVDTAANYRHGIALADRWLAAH